MKMKKPACQVLLIAVRFGFQGESNMTTQEEVLQSRSERVHQQLPSTLAL